MARAVQCDRCKTFSLPPESERRIGIHTSHQSGIQMLDLCPECDKAFDRWMACEAETRVELTVNNQALTDIVTICRNTPGPQVCSCGCVHRPSV